MQYYDETPMKRIYRKLAGGIGIAAVVFSQFAGSAYACPMLTQVLGERSEAVEGVAASEADTLMSQPALCHRHCADEQQIVNDPSSPLASVALEPAFVVTLAMMPVASLAAATLPAPYLHVRPPPLSIRNCCFRI